MIELPRLLAARSPRHSEASQQGDEINTVLWEAVALTLAARAGIPLPAWQVEMVAERPVLLLRRFDREQGVRVPFVSAMSMLEARDNDARSYLEFVDVLRQYGAAPKVDMHALRRRVVFGVLISNTDDHLRNHGFLCGLVGRDGVCRPPMI